jgi:hypothetical protein
VFDFELTIAIDESRSALSGEWGHFVDKVWVATADAVLYSETQRERLRRFEVQKNRLEKRQSHSPHLS